MVLNINRCKTQTMFFSSFGRWAPKGAFAYFCRPGQKYVPRGMSGDETNYLGKAKFYEGNPSVTS